LGATPEEAGGAEGEVAAAAASAEAAALAEEELRALADQVTSLLVISGPSGVGKGTLINRLMGDHPNQFGFSTSHTTRAPRPGEQDGVHYHFVDKVGSESVWCTTVRHSFDVARSRV
jgi:hypothetical protein